MKKILFLLLSTVAMYGQVPADATPLENIQITNNTTDNSATKVNVQSTDGTINTISKSDLVNVVEVNDVPSLPLTGVADKIYVVKNINKIYRWNGTFYQELAGSDISGKEDIANKQNSLSVDGSNIKYPTVTAVNAGLALKSNDNAVVHLAGTETITGIKTFNDISAVTNYKSSTNNVIISDTDGVVFRGVRSAAWSDNVNSRFFQVGNPNDNVTFTTRFGSAANRMLFSSLKTQISSGSFVTSIIPLGIFEVTNGTNRFFNVFESGNSVFGGSTDDLTNRLQVTGTVSSGTTALGNTPPTANNQLTRKDYVDTGLVLKAPLASPSFTGTPTAPTATAGANTTQVATTAFVNNTSNLKENTSNKQNSLAVDGSNTKYPTVTAVNTGLSTKQNYLDWATPQDYGAIGDGITDDTAAIVACFAANKNVFLYGSYKTTDYIEITANQSIYSNNATITRLSTNSSTLIANLADGFAISGNLTIIGNGKANGTATGINVVGCNLFKISGVTVKEVAGYGIRIQSGGAALPRGDGGLLINNQAINCWYGFESNSGNNGEYHSLVNFNATGCDTGVSINSGNITVTGGNIVDNNLGLFIGGSLGINGAHGIISGVNINHNALNFRGFNIDLGQTFVGCHFYGDSANSIKLENSIGVSFSNCIIDGKIEQSSTGIVGVNYFTGCQIEPSTTIENTSTNRLVFNSCFKKDGTVFNNNDIGLTSGNQPIGTGYDNLGNLFIGMTADYGINKGGSLALGGTFGAGVASTQMAFAKIHGKKENTNAGNSAGYLSFETSNNTTAPYSREVGRFSSTGDFKVVGTATATSYTATSLPVFENNAAASSLAVGQFYRTSIGVLMVKF